jgi:hypothetical protein
VNDLELDQDAAHDLAGMMRRRLVSSKFEPDLANQQMCVFAASAEAKRQAGAALRGHKREDTVGFWTWRVA